MIAYKYLKVVEQNQHNPASRKSRGQGAGETVLCPPTICHLEVNFSLMMGITNLTFISDLIPHRGKWGRTQIYSVHFMVALVRAFIYLFIKKNFTTRITQGLVFLNTSQPKEIFYMQKARMEKTNIAKKRTQM